MWEANTLMDLIQGQLNQITTDIIPEGLLIRTTDFVYLRRNNQSYLLRLSSIVKYENTDRRHEQYRKVTLKTEDTWNLLQFSRDVIWVE